MDFDFYKGKKILITGHTGFKGGWLALWLLRLGANVLGYSLEANTHPSFFNTISLKSLVQSTLGDIRDREKLNKIFNDFKPEIVFHLAAQPLVREAVNETVQWYLEFYNNRNLIDFSLNQIPKYQKVKNVLNSSKTPMEIVD